VIVRERENKQERKGEEERKRNLKQGGTFHINATVIGV